MKGLEKITQVRLAEILSHNDILPMEKITDSLYAQEASGVPFAQILVESGHITEWDLARVVTDHFNLPFVMASTYQISKETLRCAPQQLLLDHNIVPLDVFDSVLTISMPVLVGFETLEKIQAASKLKVFPCVGIPAENRKVLVEAFPGTTAAQIGPKAKASQPGAQAPARSWQTLFEHGDLAVRKDLDETAPD